MNVLSPSYYAASLPHPILKACLYVAGLPQSPQPTPSVVIFVIVFVIINVSIIVFVIMDFLPLSLQSSYVSRSM
jgi:hypothetical protein